jgi:tetratricopeptide (TPR) repeat protein
MRKINAKLFLGLLVGAIVCTGAVFAVHHFQYDRIADSLLWQARRAEEQGQVKRQARYLRRYLEFNSKDLDEKAHLAKLWAGDTFADSLRERRKAVRLLDEVLTKGEDSAELRRLLVKVALEIRQYRMARTHLEKLLTAEYLRAPTKPADGEQTIDAARGEAEGYAGQLLETENQPAKALRCYQLAVRHAPEIQSNYIDLAHLLRKLDKDYPDRALKNQAEANRIVDELVKNNRLSHEAYLARWHYRRQFNLIDLSNGASREGEKRQTVAKVRLKEAAGDVAEALQRAPESVEALLAAADLERLEAQSVLSGQGTAEDKEKGRKEHRDKALSYLNQGLKLHAKGGRQATTDLTQFRLLWHKANLLLDDVDRFDLENNGEEAAKNNEQRQEWVADAAQAVEQIRKTRGEPAAADYLKGRLLLQEQRWAEAVTLFEQVRPTLGTQPDLAGQINRCLGQCYERLAQHDQMFNAYERLLQTEPSSVAAQLGMAQAEGAMGHLDQAADIFQKLAQAKQLPAKVWLDYARLEIERQRLRSNPDWNYVEKLLDAAGEANPKTVDVQLLKAKMWTVRRSDPASGPDMTRARKVLEDAQAEKNGKDNAELWTARVYLELGAKQNKEAQRILTEAKKTLGDRVVLLRLAEANLLASTNEKGTEAAITQLASDADSFQKEDDRAALLNGLANIQLSLTPPNAAAARELLQRVAKLPSRKNDLTLKMLLFDLAIKLEDEDSQRQALDDIQAVEGSQGLFHRYGEALRLIGQAKNASDEERRKFLGEARAHLDRVHSMRSTWPPLYEARAVIARLAGPKNDEIVSNLQKAVEYGETSPAVIGELAAMLDNMGRYDEANKVLKHVREPLLVNSDLGRLKGIVALHRNDMSTAWDLLQKNRTPEGSTDYRNLLYEGRMLAEMNKPGSKEEAEKKLRKALELADSEPAPYLALVQLYAKQNREKEADALLEQARQKLKKLPPAQVQLILGQCEEILGRKKSAQARYVAALDGHRQDAAIVRRVAGFYWDANQLVEAEPLLRDIVEKRVKDPSPEDVNWARWHLALVLASGTDYGRFREAIDLVGLRLDNNGQLIRNAERERADGTDTRRFQARVLASQSGHRQFRQRARELLEELERNNALLPDDRFILAMLYEAENAWSKAKTILTQLATPKEPSPRHLAYYVQMLIEHKEFSEAAKEVERLEALEVQRGSEPNAFAAIELRARLLEENGSSKGGEKALRLLEDHIRRKTAKSEEVLLLLNSMRRQKKFAEAFDRCLKTWEEKKCKPEVIGGASVAVLRGMQLNGTPATREQVLLIEDKLKDALKDDPKSVVLMLHLAELYDQRGDWQEAEQMYRQVLRPENEPKNIVALNNLAWLLAQHASEPDKVQEALTRIEAAVNGIGRRADLIDTRGLVYLRLNQDSAALADFRDAVADMPTPAHLFHLARAHYKAQDKTNAIKILKEAKKNGLDDQASVLHPVEQKDYKRLLEELKIR